MFRLVFSGPWYIKAILGSLLIGFAAFMAWTDIDREREKAAALDAGVPAMVALDQFRNDADVHPANEVHVTGYSVADFDYVLTETRSPRRGPDYDVVRHMFVMFGPGDAGGSKAARAVAIMTPERADRFAEEMLENAVGYTDAGIVFRVNGTVSASPELSHMAEEALAREGLSKATNFVFIEPWVGSREAALAPTELSIRAGIPGSIAAVGLVLLILGFRSRRSAQQAAVAPGPVPIAPAASVPATRKRSRSLGFILIAVAAVLGVLAWKPALASSLVGYLAVAAILLLALRIAGIVPWRNKQAEAPAEDLSNDAASEQDPVEPPAPPAEEIVAAALTEEAPAPAPSGDAAARPARSGLDWASAPPAPDGEGLLNGSPRGLPKSELDWSKAPGTASVAAEPMLDDGHDPDVAAEDALQPASDEVPESRSLSDWRQAHRPTVREAQPTYITQRPKFDDSWLEPDPAEPVEDGAAPEDDTALEQVAASDEDMSADAGETPHDEMDPDAPDGGAASAEPIPVLAEPPASGDDPREDPDAVLSEAAGAKSGNDAEGTDLFLRNLVAKMHEAGPEDATLQVAPDSDASPETRPETSAARDDESEHDEPQGDEENAPVEDAVLDAFLADRAGPGSDDAPQAEVSEEAVAGILEAGPEVGRHDDQDVVASSEGGDAKPDAEALQDAAAVNREPPGDRAASDEERADAGDLSGDALPESAESGPDIESEPRQAGAVAGDGGGDAESQTDADTDAPARAQDVPEETPAPEADRFDENDGQPSPVGAGLPKRPARSVAEPLEDDDPVLADPPFAMANITPPRPSVTVAEMLARRRERLKAERRADT